MTRNRETLELLLELALVSTACGLVFIYFIAWMFPGLVVGVGWLLSQLSVLVVVGAASMIVFGVVGFVFIGKSKIDQHKYYVSMADEELIGARLDNDIKRLTIQEMAITNYRLLKSPVVQTPIRKNEKLVVDLDYDVKEIDNLLLEQPAPLPAITSEESYKVGEQWIRDFLFDGDELKVYHIKCDGPTGSGKTHLMLHMIWLLQQPHPAAEYWLIDPKFEGEESGWPFEPFVEDFDEVVGGVQWLYDNVVTGRKHAKRAGNNPTHPAFVLLDESDGCFDEHGDKFSRPVRRIIKEGRGGWVHCIIAGQSPLAKDTGFSGALFRNTSRLVLGSEAISFINNAQFNFHDKALRETFKRQLVYLQENQKRYALAIPASGKGMPFVGEIPYLAKPNFNQARTESDGYDILSIPDNGVKERIRFLKQNIELLDGCWKGGKVSRQDVAAILNERFGGSHHTGNNYQSYTDPVCNFFDKKTVMV